ncbi:MAG: YcgN family cysteine cluster protein [Methyloligellaceae bacterium]
MSASDQPFWRRKTLEQMTRAEWELLCDGCAQCCLIKLEDVDSGDLFHTRLACRLLDISVCRCTDYGNRHTQVPDCVHLATDSIGDLTWLPSTCAYRLVASGQDLPWWHPLVSGDPETVHQAGISVRSWARSEVGVPEDNYQRYVVRDPSRRGGS